MVSNILLFSPRTLGKMNPIWLPHIFQMGWVETTNQIQMLWLYSPTFTININHSRIGKFIHVHPKDRIWSKLGSVGADKPHWSDHLSRFVGSESIHLGTLEESLGWDETIHEDFRPTKTHDEDDGVLYAPKKNEDVFSWGQRLWRVCFLVGPKSWYMFII